MSAAFQPDACDGAGACVGAYDFDRTESGTLHRVAMAPWKRVFLVVALKPRNARAPCLRPLRCAVVGCAVRTSPLHSYKDDRWSC